MSRRSTRRPRLVARAAALIGLCAWCGWVSGFRRSSAPAEITWAVSLVIVAVVDLLFWNGRRGSCQVLRTGHGARWPRSGAAGTTSVLAGASPWIALVLVVLAWEILGVDTGRNEPHLTISALSQAFRPLNAATLLLWMLVGIGYGAARAAVASPPRRPPAAGEERGLAMLVVSPKTLGLVLPPSRGAGIAFWLGIVAVAALIELGARRSRGRVATAEQLLLAVTRSPVGNMFVVVAWTFAGYHLFAR